MVGINELVDFTCWASDETDPRIGEKTPFPLSGTYTPAKGHMPIETNHKATFNLFRWWEDVMFINFKAWGQDSD